MLSCPPRVKAPSSSPNTGGVTECRLVRACRRAHATQKGAVHGELALWAISDLHCDYENNAAWVRGLCRPTAPTGACHVLLVAGDVSDNVSILRSTLSHLTTVFDHVFFVSGNHEQWVGRGDSARDGGAGDSVAKLHVVLELCAELGVHTSPAQLGRLWVVPILSWHHKSWDAERDVPGIPKASALTITDYRACLWPPTVPGADEIGSEGVAEWMDAANERLLDATGSWSHLWQSWRRGGGGDAAELGTAGPHMVTLSHFLPHQELLPEKRFLTFPNLAKAVGSAPLRRRVLQLQPHMHVFGHSHFSWDATIQGTRFLQAPLCYPAEQRGRQQSISIQRDARWADWPSFDGHSAASAAAPARATHRSTQHDHQHHAADGLDWLPVLIYRASWEAEQAVAGTGGAGAPASSAATSSWQLLRHSDGGLVSAMGGDIDADGRHSDGGLVSAMGGDIDADGEGLATSGSAGAGRGASGYSITRWKGEACPPLCAMWSEHYALPGSRTPDDVQLAPWVLNRYSKYARFAAQLAAHQAAVATRAGLDAPSGG